MPTPPRFTTSISKPLASVPLLDIGRENGPLEQEIQAAMAQVTRSGRFVLGPEVQQLEQRISRLCEVPHSVGCASGSDALLLALMAIDLQPGDEVIVPSFSFFATASAVTRLGAKPIFVDIDPQTFNIDPECVRAAVTDKTKAIIPVHLFGLAADMEAICEIARPRDIVVIEDAAQAIGARADGRAVGSLGDIACFSFYPTKNLGGFGDGGMLTTKSDEIADRLRLLRGHGMHPRYYHSMVGINSRLDTLQAAVLNIKLPHLKNWSNARAKNASQYERLFERAELTNFLDIPQHSSTSLHVWNQYTVRVPGHRDQLRAQLNQHNVGSEIYYPVPLHQQECFADLEQRFSLPVTERAAREVLSLPVFPTLTAAEQETVVYRIAEFAATQNATSEPASKRKAA